MKKKKSKKRIFKQTKTPGVRSFKAVDGTVKYVTQRRTKDGKRPSKTFDSYDEAKRWFPCKKKKEILRRKSHAVVNGSYTDMTLGELIKKWKLARYPNKDLESPSIPKGQATIIPKIEGRLSLSSASYLDRKLTHLFDDDSILNLFLHEIDGAKIVEYISVKHVSSKRKTWKGELRILCSIFNWYIKKFKRKNPTFFNPIDSQTMNELSIPTVNAERKKRKYLNQEELADIKKVLEPNNLYHNLFALQLLFGTRMGEMLGLLWENVDFKKRNVCFRYTAFFSKNIHFKGLQSLKDKSIREINKDLIDIAEEVFLKIKESSESIFVFGASRETPVTPRQVRYQYNQLLKKAGLNPGDYQSITHLVRHTSAQMVYNLTGDLNATQAHTGHRNRDMVENLYAADHPRRLAKDAMSELGKNFL